MMNNIATTKKLTGNRSGGSRLGTIPHSYGASFAEFGRLGASNFEARRLMTANKIASRTRRGAGNWAVVSPTALTILQSATTSAFARTTEGTFEAPTNTKFVGTLNGAMRVFVDSYAPDTTPVLVGYKGSSETDAAAFYCPYIPLMSSGVVLDPSTFEPVVSFMTRYGYIELTNTASSFGNAADYVGEIAVQNLTFQ